MSDTSAERSPIGASLSASVTAPDISTVPSSQGSGLESSGDEPNGAHHFICRICLSVMICPVTLPCGHDLCLECFKRSTALVNLLCPFCRLRISCWARKAKTTNQLIDWTKWNNIQQKYPELASLQTSDTECAELFCEQLECESVHRVIASEGEIRQELEELNQRERQRLMEEENASQELIKQMIAEDQRMEQLRAQLAEQTANDELIARTLHSIDNNVKTLRNRTYLSQ